MRKHLLVNEQVYHVFSRSIAGFKIFNNAEEYSRMLEVVRYYQKDKPDIKFSKFIKLSKEVQADYSNALSEKEKLVDIIAYCIMPTHVHFILKQQKQNGISIFMSNILNSYTRYFNTKHERKGPLWESKFKNVLVETEEYLLHLTRYIHLNPVTSELIKKPEQWTASSYNEYLSNDNNATCEYNDLLEIDPRNYRDFVEDRISYQKELHKIKSLLCE